MLVCGGLYRLSKGDKMSVLGAHELFMVAATAIVLVLLVRRLVDLIRCSSSKEKSSAD